MAIKFAYFSLSLSSLCRQMLWATADPPHIVVGNPKALQRLVDLGRLRLNAVGMVVLDEVDACIIEPTTKKVSVDILTINDSDL